MAKPQRPEPGGSIYKAALEKLSPEMREAFVDACVTSGLSEDDVAHALLLAESKVLDAFKSAHSREVAAVVQGVVNGVAQRVETIQTERHAADLKQQQLLANQVEEIRRRQHDLTTRETKGWQKTILQHGITAAVTAVVVSGLAYWLDAKRVDEAVARTSAQSDARYWSGINALSAAARFISELDEVKGNLHYTYTSGKDAATGMVINFGTLPLVAPSKSAPNEVTIEFEPSPTPTPTPDRSMYVKPMDPLPQPRHRAASK
jgi:hypothetical protein